MSAAPETMRVWLGGLHGWVTVSVTATALAERYELREPITAPRLEPNEPDFEGITRDREWVAHENASYT